jgi:sugar lactone lactonase YvrE
MFVAHTASAVNFAQVTGAATGGAPTFSSQGSDTNINMSFVSKGSGGFRFFSQAGGARQFQINNTASAVNYPIVTGAITGAGPVYSVEGTDTNIDIALNPKGTGTVVANGPFTATDATFTEVAVTTAAGESAFNENDTITGWLYSGKTFTTTGQESVPNGLFIGSAGTKMYINGSTGDDVNEYTLGTAWDITTATFVTVFSTAGQDTAPQDVFFKPDGLSMYVVGSTNDTVYQYTLGTAWSVATASYASKSFSVASQEVTPAGVWFKPDGTVMYVVGTSTDTVYQYALSTAWDVSTASYGGVFYSVAAQESSPAQVNLSDDGLKMWLLGQTGDDIWEYDLGTAWDVSTATPVNNFYVGFQETAPTGLFIDSTASNRVYIVGSSTDAVYQYNTETNSLKLDTEKLYVGGVMSVNGDFVAGARAYVDGTLNVQGATQLSTTTVNGSLTAASTITLGGSTTGTSSFGTTATTGTTFIGGTAQTGAMTIGRSTVSQTTDIQAGATTSGNTKTINFGTAGVSGSTTNINIGSAVSGSLGTTTIQAPTVNIGQLATQFAVTNTASAVNYVQVTGAATGGTTVVSSQGSDASVNLGVAAKGSGVVRLFTGGTTEQFRVLNTASAVNFATATGSTAGNAVSYSVAGTDTNIDIALNPKGTGNVRFGTYTADMTLIVQGYVEIKDSGGTIRKLAVIA